MGLGSLATRQKAIPFRANWYDGSGVGNQFPDVGPWADLYSLSNGNTSYIRLALPTAGDLVQLRLTLQAINVTATTQMRIALGRFAADGINVDTTRTAAERAADWLKISGQEALYSWAAGEQILIDGLDLLKALPKEGEPGYSSDGFVLYVGIASSNVAGWELQTFKVDGSVQIGVL